MRFAFALSVLFAWAGPIRAGASLGKTGTAPDGAGSPTVRVEKNQRMLALVVKGDPDRTGDSAVAALLRHFFLGAGEAEKNAPIRPRVRWVLRSPALARSAWIAAYALPVSETFPAPPLGAVAIVTWPYGLIAESAYAGAYAGAQPAIDSLKGYIARSGFALIGEMEEEFERGRGTLYQGHPETYRTFIRYRIHDAGRGDAAPLSVSP